MTILTVQAIPPSPNVLKRKYRHPQAYRRLRSVWELALKGSAPSPSHRDRLVHQAKDCSKLWVQITLYHSRFYDEDNLQGSQKVLLDALVNIGFLKADNPVMLELLPATQVKVARRDLKTVIKIGVVD